MIIQNWLIINNRGTTRLTKNKPALNWDEIAMLLNIEMPDSVFKRPQIQANIKIDGEMNYEFDYETQQKINDVLHTLPNVHLVKVDVVKEVKEDDQ